MPQIFHRSANTIARLTILGAVLLVSLTGWLLASVSRSDYLTEADVVREQVPFSHKHHVGGGASFPTDAFRMKRSAFKMNGTPPHM
jgi:hypothetical protein